MMKYWTIDSNQGFTDKFSIEAIVNFLYEHLDRFGDSKEAIRECITYAMSAESGKGGYILLATEGEDIAGVVVMISTGMKFYIPENFLVYIAVHAERRNQGLGGKLIKQVFENTKGDIALHVEYDNPAKRLYERVGFSNKYAEMRYHKEE